MYPRLLLGLFLALISSSTALALEYEVISPPSGSGLGEVAITLMFQDEEAITIEIDKWTLDAEQEIVVEFTRQAGDPDTLIIADEIVLNVTDYEWIGYDIWVTDATGTQDSAFVSFIDPDLVENFKQTGGITRFEYLAYTDTELNFDNDPITEGVPSGTVFDAPYNQVVFRGIQIDMPDLDGSDQQTFRLYQKPRIPEPAGGLILAACLLTWSGANRTRRARNGARPAGD